MQCPGQDSRYWDEAAIFDTTCVKCGADIEFFKDDSTRKCSKCGKRMLNPRTDFGCAEYCPYAEQCLGTMPPELLAGKQNLLKDRIAIEVKRYFGHDLKRIAHAKQVALYAEKIGEQGQGNPAVIAIAAYLHDIGLKEAERKFNSTAVKYQHQEGPPVAREILTRLGANEGLITEVCDIIGHHHSPRQQETANFKVVYDADLIVNLNEKKTKGEVTTKSLTKILQQSFLTSGGSALAAKVLLG